MSASSADLKPTYKHLIVVGLGLIGGSLAMAARDRFSDITITAVDTDEKTLQFALRSNIADHVSRDLPSVLEDDTLVVLACHLNGAMDALKKLAPLAEGKNVTLSDVGSCKRPIYNLGLELAPHHFIAAHPMAGKEFSGINNATGLLFAGQSFIICPQPDVGATRLETLKRFIVGLGAIPRNLTPEKHDYYMAYVSHLPQFYSLALTNLLYHREPGHLLSYHGGGIDGQLRLAASPHSMWGEVFEHNQDNIKVVIEELSSTLKDASDLMGAEGLKAWFDRSNQIHQEFHNLNVGMPL